MHVGGFYWMIQGQVENTLLSAEKSYHADSSAGTRDDSCE